MDMIPWGVAIKQMKTLNTEGFAVPFDIEFDKADVKRKTGGVSMSMTGVIVSGLKKQSKLAKHKEKLQDTIARTARNPHHSENGTLNLYDPKFQHNVTVHLRLITKFNGKTVVY